MYSMVCTRPNIAQVVRFLSRYMSNAGRVHWDAVKRVFTYLKGTSEYSMCYHGNLVGDIISVDIHGYVYLERVGDIDSRRSTSAYVSTLFGGLISWMSKQLVVVAPSTTKEKYMASNHACKEAIWLKRLCSDIGIKQGTLTVYCDSQNAIYLAKNLRFYARTKYIDVQYHFVKDMVEDGMMKMVKVETLVNVLDSLTKAMNTKKFRWCLESMGLMAPNN